MKIIVPILNRFVSIKLSGILFIFLLLSSWGINAQQASNITFTGVTTTTLSFNWTDGTVGNRIVVIKDAAGTFTPAVNTTYTANLNFTSGTDLDAGAPSGYLVIQRSGAAPTGTPTSGQGYTVGTVIDDGTVAFVGNAVTFNNTSLTVGTTYHYAIFSYNGNAASTNYRTATPLTGNQATQAAAPANPVTNITFTALGATSYTINWTNADNTNALVVIDDAAIGFSPTNGTDYPANTDYAAGTDLGSGQKSIFNGAGTSVTVTNLTAGTVYHVRIFPAAIW